MKKWHRPFIGGNPWLNLWDDNNNRISAYYSEQIEKINGFLASRIKILLTLQPGISNHGIPYRLMRVIDTSPSDWFWLIRLHPGMIQERRNVQKLMAECSHKRYNIDDATDLPLPSILKKVDVHVTFYSSTIIEANRYGIPSIVLSDKGEELYIEQFKSGWAETAYDETSLRLIIEQRCKQKRIFDNFDSKLNDTKEKIQWLMKDLNILG
jgi:hypothetical protein